MANSPCEPPTRLLNMMNRARGGIRPGELLRLRFGVPELDGPAVRVEAGLGDALLGVAQPVPVGVLTVGLQVRGAIERLFDRLLVADGDDDVRGGVRDTVEQDAVPDALDAGARRDPLALDAHRLGAALPHGVDDRLDVLLVDDEELRGDADGIHVRGGVRELSLIHISEPTRQAEISY